MSTWPFLVMQIASPTYLFYHGVGMWYLDPVPILHNILCKYLLQLGKLVNTWLLPEIICKTCVGKKRCSCSKQVQERYNFILGMLWESSKKACGPSCEM